MNHDIALLREVVVKITQMLAGMGITVTQRGTQAYVSTDKRTLKPTRVNIPYIPDNASEKLIFAIQGFIDHEVAHILFTDWAVVREAGELGRAIDSLHNILEDTYIERAIAARFPGSGYNLDRLHRFFVEHITLPAFEKVKGKPANEFGVLMPPMARAWAGQKVFVDFMEAYWGRVEPYVAAIGDLAKEIPAISSSRQALDLAIRIDRVLPKSAAPKKSKKRKNKKEPTDPLSKRERKVLAAIFDRRETVESIARKAKRSVEEIEAVRDSALAKLKGATISFGAGA